MGMKVLFLIVVMFIVYGSLFPFDFEIPLAHGAAIKAFLTSWTLLSSRGDVLANIALFVPFGFLGIQAFFPRNSRAAQLISILLFGSLLGLALQFLQIYIPSRTENLGDALWNCSGAALGAAATVLLSKLAPDVRLDRLLAYAGMPMALLGIWVAWRIFPFIPSIDLQLFKQSLTPLLLRPQFSTVDTLRELSGWLAVFSLAAAAVPGRRSAAIVVCAIPVLFALEVVIITNSVTASDVAGAMAAVVFWLLILRRIDRREQYVAALLALSIFLQGLLPLERRYQPADFGWIPFAGLLEGAVTMHAQALLGKTFFFSALLWLLKKSGYGLRNPAILLATLIAGLEMVQVYFGTNTPEVTDLVLLVLIVAALYALDSEQLNSSQRSPRT